MSGKYSKESQEDFQFLDEQDQRTARLLTAIKGFRIMSAATRRARRNLLFACALTLIVYCFPHLVTGRFGVFKLTEEDLIGWGIWAIIFTVIIYFLFSFINNLSSDWHIYSGTKNSFKDLVLNYQEIAEESVYITNREMEHAGKQVIDRRLPRGRGLHQDKLNEVKERDWTFDDLHRLVLGENVKKDYDTERREQLTHENPEFPTETIKKIITNLGADEYIKELGFGSLELKQKQYKRAMERKNWSFAELPKYIEYNSLNKFHDIGIPVVFASFAAVLCIIRIAMAFKTPTIIC